MRDYVVKVQVGSTDEVRVKGHLRKMGIKYSENKGVFDGIYIRFETDKATWKRIKKKLNLVIESVYCKPNLEESGV